MPTFRYTGRNAQGAKISGAIEGASADSVAGELLSRQITPLTIEASESQTGSGDALAMLREKLRRKRVDLDELIIFSRQMYSLSKAGVPIIPTVIWGAQRVWTKGYPKRLGRTNTPISIAVGEPLPPVGPPNELTEKLRTVMQKMLLELQESYHHEPGAYWVPARLGGSAPTLEEADKLDAQDLAARAAKRAE